MGVKYGLMGFLAISNTHNFGEKDKYADKTQEVVLRVGLIKAKSTN